MGSTDAHARANVLAAIQGSSDKFDATRRKVQMQGAQNLSEPGPLGAATTKLKRNAADGLFTKPSEVVSGLLVVFHRPLFEVLSFRAFRSPCPPVPPRGCTSLCFRNRPPGFPPRLCRGPTREESRADGKFFGALPSRTRGRIRGAGRLSAGSLRRKRRTSGTFSPGKPLHIHKWARASPPFSKKSVGVSVSGRA